MSIAFYNEDVDKPLFDYTKAESWLQEVIESTLKTVGSLSVVFCSDEYLLKMNRQFLNHDYYTDIITFNYSSRKTISGDLFISVDTVESNAANFNLSFHDELHRVIVHGVLHLLGWDDSTDADRIKMRAQEDFWLEKLSGLAH